MSDKFKFSGKNRHLDLVVEVLQEVKAEKITVVATGEDSPVADWVVICEGNSFVHVRAIADKVREYFKKNENMLPFHEEGKQFNRWILLDYTDIVVNIMLPELREHYKLEELWEEYEQADIEE